MASPSPVEELALPIILTEQFIKLAIEPHTNSYQVELANLTRLACQLSEHVHRIVTLITTTSATLYLHPVHRIATKLSKNLYCALNLVRKCTRSGLLCFVFATFIDFTNEFMKVEHLLESSIGDLRWLNFILDPLEQNFYPPPILNSNPTLVVVWTLVGKLHANNRLSDRITAAEKLTSVVKQDDEYRKLVIKEGGISTLLLLLKDATGCSEAEIAATKALNWLIADNDIETCNSLEIVCVLVSKLGNENLDVAVEALNGLKKFACFGNHNCVKHSKMIIEFDGVPLLMKLMSVNEQIKIEGLVLLSYLCINVKNSSALADTRLLKTLDSVLGRMTQDSSFKVLLFEAKHYLLVSQESLHLPVSYDFSVL